MPFIQEGDLPINDPSAGWDGTFRDFRDEVRWTMEPSDCIKGSTGFEEGRGEVGVTGHGWDWNGRLKSSCTKLLVGMCPSGQTGKSLK